MAEGGFSISFASVKDVDMFQAAIEQGSVEVKAAAVDAVKPTVDALKLKLRSYFDGVFSGSPQTRNLHSRVANAIVQDRLYDDVESKGQFSGLIYSKLGRGLGPGGFIDYLLLHLRGGTVAPQQSQYLTLAVSDDARALAAKGGFIPTGNFKAAGTKVFFVQSKDDPNKLFLLRSTSRTGATQLLAVLLKNVTIAPRLSGLQPLLDEAGGIYERNVDALWTARGGEGGAGS